MIARQTKSATVTSGAVSTMASFGFDAGKLAEANIAWISCGTNNINITWSGDNPSATVGHPVIKTASLTSNGSFEVCGKENVANIKLIGLGGSSVVTITIGR